MHERRTRLRGVLAPLALAAVLVACSSGGSSAHHATTTARARATTTTGATRTTTTAASTTAPAATDPAPGGPTTTAAATTVPPGATTTAPTGEVLPAGDTYAFVKRVSTGTVDGRTATLLTFDEVQYLTGDAAKQAAAAHHDLDPSGDLPDDYYLVNDNPRLRTVALAPTATITVLGCDGGCVTQVPATATGLVAQGDELFVLTGRTAGGRSTITSVRGVYRP